MDIPQDEIEKYKPYILYYLTEHNCAIDKPFTCFNPDHPDRHPSMYFWSKINKCKCFSCGKVYDIYDLVQIENNCTFNEAFEIVRDKYGNKPPPIVPKSTKYSEKTGVSNHNKSSVNISDLPLQTINSDGGLNVSYAQSYKEWVKNLPMTDYLTKRGISFETAQRHWIGYNPDYKIKTKDGNEIGKGAIIIPTSDESYNLIPTCDDNEVYPRYQKRGPAHIFNSQVLLDKSKTVYVTEGELDALSIEEVGFDAVALGGGNIDLFLRFLKENNVQCIIILMLDNDVRGRQFESELSEKLNELGIEYRTGSFSDEDHSFKDPNEALIKDRFFLKKKLAELLQSNQTVSDSTQAKAFLAEKSVAAHKEQMLKILNENTIKRIPTGIAALDNALLGGLGSGATVIGAIPSCGKTTLSLQMASYIAANGNIVVYVSLEMAKEHLIAKSIAREIAINSRKNGYDIEESNISASDILLKYNALSPDERKKIMETLNQFCDTAGKNLMIMEGEIGQKVTAEYISTKIEEIVKAYSEKNQVVVFIDYLQIIPTQNNISNDKMAVDSNMAIFQQMANQLKIPVVIISSLGRASYNKPVSLDSFKESGSIEYSADTLIGLQYQGVGDKSFDLNTARTETTRKLELVILKQRMGALSDTIKLDYYPACDLFVDPYAQIIPSDSIIDDDDFL